MSGLATEIEELRAEIKLRYDESDDLRSEAAQLDRGTAYLERKLAELEKRQAESEASK